MTSKSTHKCISCHIAEMPQDRQWWWQNKTFHCPVCGAEIKRSRSRALYDLVFVDAAGWAIGATVLTLGLALVILIPLYLLLRLVFVLLPKYRMTRPPTTL